MDNNYIDNLFKEAKLGDMEKLTELFLCFKGYIYSKASTYYIKGYSLEDLISLGNLSLLKAYNSFDIKKGTHFAHYAIAAIKTNFNYYYRSAKMNNTISLSTPIGDVTLEDKLYETSALDDYMTEQELLEIRQAVLKLEPSLRSIIIFVYYKGKTVKEYSQKYNMSYYEARVLRLRAEQKLRKLL